MGTGDSVSLVWELIALFLESLCICWDQVYVFENRFWYFETRFQYLVNIFYILGTYFYSLGTDFYDLGTGFPNLGKFSILWKQVIFILGTFFYILGTYFYSLGKVSTFWNWLPRCFKLLELFHEETFYLKILSLYWNQFYVNFDIALLNFPSSVRLVRLLLVLDILLDKGKRLNVKPVRSSDISIHYTMALL